jgi:RND superfamily putative drug exporter
MSTDAPQGGTVLSVLARTATRRPLTVILFWLLFLLLGFGLGTGVFGRLSDNVPDVPGTESEHAAQYLDRTDPTGESITGVVAGVGPSPTCVALPGSPPYRIRTPPAGSRRATGAP